MNKILPGTVSLVTGSARGLGAAIVRELAECGSDVAIHYRRSRTSAEALAKDVRSSGRRAEIFCANLNYSSAARQLVQEVHTAFNRLDHLVYNVGPLLTTPFTALSDDEWDEILNCNLKSAWATSVEAAPFLRSSGHGRIIHIGANSAYVRTHSVYGLAKAALVHLTEALAVELAPHITVNCIAPGMIEGSEPDEKTRDLVVDRTPLQRLVRPEEIARMCAAVCSPTFDSVTGRTLVMDGGRWLR